MQTIHYQRLKPRLEELELALARLGSLAFELVDELPQPEGDTIPSGFQAQVLLRDTLADLVGTVNAARGTAALVGDQERKGWQRFTLNELEERVGLLLDQAEDLAKHLDDVNPKDVPADWVLLLGDDKRALIEPAKTELATEVVNLERYLGQADVDEAIRDQGRRDDALTWSNDLERVRVIVHQAETTLSRAALNAEAAQAEAERRDQAGKAAHQGDLTAEG